METRKQTEPQARILLVDDERNLVTMLGKILKRHGHDVVLAENGEDALPAGRVDPFPPTRMTHPAGFRSFPSTPLCPTSRMPKMDG
jgi:CheY-like chemotaxis protein